METRFQTNYIFSVILVFSVLKNRKQFTFLVANRLLFLDEGELCYSYILVMLTGMVAIWRLHINPKYAPLKIFMYDVVILFLDLDIRILSNSDVFFFLILCGIACTLI